MLDLRLASFGPLSDMGIRTSTPQVHVWLQPLSARAQSAPRSTRSTTWQAQRGLRSSSASEGRPRLRAVSGPAGTACHGDSHQPGHCGRDGGKLRIDTEADRPSESPAASKHLCGRTIFRHHPWCKPSPSILVLAAVSVLAPVQNGLAETASADGAISTQ